MPAADAPPKLPPVRAARAVDSLRRTLRRIERKLQPPNASVLELISSAWAVQAVYTATKLGIIDELRDGPKTSDAVAEGVGADPDAVYRLMRLLASRGLFTRRRDGRFALAPMGEALRADAPGSIRGYVLFAGDPLHWEHWGQLSHSVRTGRCAVEEVRGKPTFEWFDDVPELAAVFNDGMTSISKMETPAVVSAYDFSRFGTIADVGGGHGLLLAAILRQAPNSRGILFDAEPVVNGAHTVLESAGVSARCATVGGSFFKSVPAGADAYVLKHIIHDWDDEKSVQILRNVRTAMKPDATVLIVEAVVPDDDREHLSKLLDLEMLVAANGRERTQAEYAELLRQAGFRFTRTVPTVGPASIVEAVAT
jgi:O-methyltransferase domain/Dimerisation domain